MGRPKGGINKYWSKDDKFKVIKPILDGEISLFRQSKIMVISSGMITTWIKRYNDGGLESLENKRKPGNPLIKFQRKNNLTELEQLQYENMKLRIENERLKKGYTSEEADQLKLTFKKNTK